MTRTRIRTIETTERFRRIDLKNKTRWGTLRGLPRKADFLVEQQGFLILLHPMTNKTRRWTLAFIGYEPLNGRFCIGNCYRLFDRVFDAIEHEGWTVSAITADE